MTVKSHLFCVETRSCRSLLGALHQCVLETRWLGQSFDSYAPSLLCGPKASFWQQPTLVGWGGPIQPVLSFVKVLREQE